MRTEEDDLPIQQKTAEMMSRGLDAIEKTVAATVNTIRSGASSGIRQLAWVVKIAGDFVFVAGDLATRLGEGLSSMAYRGIEISETVVQRSQQLVQIVEEAVAETLEDVSDDK